MRRIVGLLFMFLTLFYAQTENTCMTCHEGVADIRDKNSGMMQAILKRPKKQGLRAMTV